MRKKEAAVCYVNKQSARCGKRTLARSGRNQPDAEATAQTNKRLFVTDEIQYHGGLRSRELGQAPILLCVPNS